MTLQLFNTAQNYQGAPFRLMRHICASGALSAHKGETMRQMYYAAFNLIFPSLDIKKQIFFALLPFHINKGYKGDKRILQGLQFPQANIRLQLVKSILNCKSLFTNENILR